MVYRALIVLLSAQLASGCTTLVSVETSDLRAQLQARARPLGIRTVEGSTARLDPNSEVRFFLRDGSVTRWIEGRELWHSQVGLSFGERDGVFLLRWGEIAGAEARNLSALKTAGVIMVAAIVVGLVVLAVLARAKGGGGGGSFHIAGGGGRSKTRAVIRPARRPLLPPARGGVHVHVPIAVVDTRSYEAPSPLPRDVPYAPVASIGGVPLEEPTDMAPAEQRSSAVPLFDASMRRRFSIQLLGSAAVGTELARFDRYAGSLYLGLRIRDAIDLGGGVRHMLAPLAPTGASENRSSVVGFGRLGAHLGFGTSKRGAIALSLDVGSGYNALLQLKFNMGLRFRPTERVSVGLFPFTPTFSYYKEDSPFEGALRWTFPTTLELSFAL